MSCEATAFCIGGDNLFLWEARLRVAAKEKENVVPCAGQALPIPEREKESAVPCARWGSPADLWHPF
ncbi:MAG: hypothetical protein LBJ70_03165 [Holosporales bacterium]|nr:hypothetical protein [Holosporales bacterium]